MSVIEYPPKPIHKLKRQQLETVCIALEGMRDEAIRQRDDARAKLAAAEQERDEAQKRADRAEAALAAVQASATNLFNQVGFAGVQAIAEMAGRALAAAEQPQDGKSPTNYASFHSDPSSSMAAAEQPEPRTAKSATERDPESYCHRCEGPNVSWAAPSPLWNAMMRRGASLLWGEIICPTCFAVLAEQAGIATGWRLYAETELVDVPTVSPGGRIWNRDSWLWGPACSAEQPEPEQCSTCGAKDERPTFEQLLADPTEQFDTKSELREAIMRLIKAAAEAIDKQLEDDSYGPNSIAFSEYFGERAGWSVLQAVIPLIADAIEAERPKDTRARLPFDDGYDAAVCTAARLVRSLGGNDGSSDG